ncbi:hypothetical protein D3C76_1278400 [compost metagenome]
MDAFNDFAIQSHHIRAYSYPLSKADAVTSADLLVPIAQLHQLRTIRVQSTVCVAELITEGSLLKPLQ